jgi:hypothetical protein
LLRSAITFQIFELLNSYEILSHLISSTCIIPNSLNPNIKHRLRAAAMRLLFLAILPLAVIATPNGRCTGDKATGFWKESGICISTSNCRNRGGKTKNDACPFDGDDIKCCLIGVEPSDVNPCGEYSYCTWTENGCQGGTWNSGRS